MDEGKKYGFKVFGIELIVILLLIIGAGIFLYLTRGNTVKNKQQVTPSLKNFPPSGIGTCNPKDPTVQKTSVFYSFRGIVKNIKKEVNAVKITITSSTIGEVGLNKDSQVLRLNDGSVKNAKTVIASDLKTGDSAIFNANYDCKTSSWDTLLPSLINASSQSASFNDQNLNIKQ